MSFGRSALHALELAGWEFKDKIPAEAIDQLGETSPTAIVLFDAVGTFYEILYHNKTDRWMLVTDGGGSFTTNAEGILIASPDLELKSTNNESHKAHTLVFTIGLSDKTVEDWLVWVGVNHCLPDRRPDRGFNYVS